MDGLACTLADPAHGLGAHRATGCLHPAHSSTSGQRLPQPPQSWICRDTLLLMEKNHNVLVSKRLAGEEQQGKGKTT